jgi:hypothetical protein
MWNLALLFEMILVVLVTYYLLSKLGWRLGDRIFWTIMAVVGSAFCWLKWIEPMLAFATRNR